jgi:hypothetical protein
LTPMGSAVSLAPLASSRTCGNARSWVVGIGAGIVLVGGGVEAADIELPEPAPHPANIANAAAASEMHTKSFAFTVWLPQSDAPWGEPGSGVLRYGNTCR